MSLFEPCQASGSDSGSDVSQASVTRCILLLMLFSTRDLEHARRVEDTFILVVVVKGMNFSKGLTNYGVAMKACSYALRRSFSLSFFISIPLMESFRISLVTW